LQEDGRRNVMGLHSGSQTDEQMETLSAAPGWSSFHLSMKVSVSP